VQLKKLEPLGIIEPLPLDDIGPRKVALFKTVQLQQVVLDSLLLCAFLPYTFEQVASVTAAVTGWNTSMVEQLRVAEKILTMARLFNIREGFTAADDALPQRFFQPKTNGALADKPLNPAKFEQAKSYYYTLMGWDAHTGIPTPEKLEELGIL
jgi:aldehyde:ferredoxin oxidoreductase